MNFCRPTNIKKTLFLTGLVAVFLFSAGPVLAFWNCQGPIVPCGLSENATGTLINEALPCTLCSIFALINNIIKFVLGCIVPIVATIMMIFGGFYLLAAGPSPDKVNKARGVLTAAVIGIAIIFVAWILLNTFLDRIGVAKWTGLRDNPETSVEEGWWQIECK